MAGIDHSYEEGLRDGKIGALEDKAMAHERRFTNHEIKFTAQDARFRVLERLMWLLMGGIAFMNFYPTIKTFLTITP